MEHARRRGLARLMLRWPDRRAQLRAFSPDDARLGELFEAYELACEAASYWQKSDAPFGLERAREYQALADATEEDILLKIS